MLSAKDIIKMEKSVVHSSEPQRTNAILHAEEASDFPSSSSSDFNPALVSRRDGKPIFTATPTSAAGSPVLAERRSTDEKHKKKVRDRSGSKKRSTSQKKKDQTNMTSQLKGKKEGVLSKKKRDKESSQDSPTSLMNISMATCSIGVPIIQQGKQTRLPEYEYVRKELVVTVRDAVIQTDLF